MSLKRSYFSALAGFLILKYYMTQTHNASLNHLLRWIFLAVWTAYLFSQVSVLSTFGNSSVDVELNN